MIRSANSPETLVARVDRAMDSLGHNSLTHVSVSASAHAIVLEGRVPSYHARQIALSCAQGIDSNVMVIDRLEVRPRTPSP